MPLMMNPTPQVAPLRRVGSGWQMTHVTPSCCIQLLPPCLPLCVASVPQVYRPSFPAVLDWAGCCVPDCAAHGCIIMQQTAHTQGACKCACIMEQEPGARLGRLALILILKVFCVRWPIKGLLAGSALLSPAQRGRRHTLCIAALPGVVCVCV